MTLVPKLFAHLPDSARIWIFGTSRALDPAERTELLRRVDDFLLQWKAHGMELSAAREWRHERFLIVAVDDRVATPSGCSIDALLHGLTALENELGFEIVGGAPVWYRKGGDSGRIERISRPDFKALAEAGGVDAETIVFDLSLTRLGELRADGWEKPAAESWHHRYLRSTSDR